MKSDRNDGEDKTGKRQIDFFRIFNLIQENSCFVQLGERFKKYGIRKCDCFPTWDGSYHDDCI